MTACDVCLRRSWLLAQLSGRLEIAHLERRPVRDVLALGEDELPAALAAVGGPGPPAWAGRFDAAAARREAAASGLATVCRHDAGYPGRLLDDRSAPALLHVLAAGGLRRLTQLVGAGGERPPAVAIVGTRRASDDGLELGRALGRGLAAAGVTVVSGMALGVDSAAHEGALEAGGATVAVLAGGADVPYPRSKRGLHARIAAAGAVVGELPPGTGVRRWAFPARNRIIAGLADATVVVQAAQRSGSLITAEMAMDLGREVGAVPGSPLSWRASGTNALLRDGATVVRDARDALDLVLGVDGASAALEAQASARTPLPADLEPALDALLARLADGADTVGQLARTPQEVAVVSGQLAELVLLGLVRRAPGGRYAPRVP
ncbi:MAG TPA: DNA-processing protein DprA [Baekduia sp.]|nr:DNA-processing protein DprA [Baekduia sp.]